MNHLISRLQKDLVKLQTTIQKEGNDLLEKIKKLDLKDNISGKKKELEKVIDTKLGRIEPVYNKVMVEIRKNAKKAGIDLVKLEKEIKKQAKAAGKKIKSKKTTKKAKKKTAAGKKTATTAKKKTAKKTKSATKVTSRKSAKKTVKK